MITSVFQITGIDPYPSWVKTESGKSAPLCGLALWDVTDDPKIKEFMCVVYGYDAIKHYEVGDYVMVTVDILITIDENESFKQEIRVLEVKKINLPKA